MKKERYIREIRKGSSRYLQVQIKYKDGEAVKYWTKLINLADYTTPSEALKAAIVVRDKAVADLRIGRLVKHTPTVAELFERTKTLFNITIPTWKRHRLAYEHSIKPYGNKEISAVKAADIQQSLNESINKYSADATERVIAVWRQIYKAAVMDGVMVPDLTAVVQMPRDKHPAAKKKPVLISAEDFQKYINFLLLSDKYVQDEAGKFRRKRIYYILMILYHTGMRPAEAMALEWSDIDLDQHTISVTKAVGSTATARRQIVTTKTAASVRMVPISDALDPILRQMMVDLPKKHPLYDYDGLPFEIDFLSNYVRRTAKKCGIDFHLYMLRHTMVHSLREADVAPRVQQDILGHTSYNMTISYDRSTEDEKRHAVDIRKMS